MVDVYMNGSKLKNGDDFTATNGTTVVLASGAQTGDVVEIYNYLTAFIPTNALRLVTVFTATAGQTTFSVSYTQGLIDVFYNGSLLAPSKYTATNGTTIVLGTACQLNDIVEVIAYSYTVGAYSGIGGGGTTNYMAKFYSTNTIGSGDIYNGASGFISIGNTNTTYNLDVTGTGRFTGNVTVGSGTGLSQLTVGNGAGYTGVVLSNGSSIYSWLLGSQYNINNGFEITPSTAIGGSTFTTPVFKILNTGAATFSSSVTNTSGMLLNVGATGTNANTNYTTFANGVYSALNSSTPTEGVGMWSDNQGNGMIGSLYDNNASSLNFVVRASSSTNGKRAMVINGLGNVGIGTTSPLFSGFAQLTVNGTQGVLQYKEVQLGIQDYFLLKMIQVM